MTGRRLYDLICDRWAKESKYTREQGLFLGDVPLQWSFLTWGEQRTFSNIASKLSGPHR